MKINKYTFILPILFIIILYLLGAFIAADIDFSNWDTFGRGCLASLMIFFIIMGVMLSQEIKEN